MTYRKSVDLPVGPDEAFALLTEPERLRRWQVVSAVVDLRAGGSYRWTVTPGHIASGTVREVEPGRRLVLGWGWEGSDDVPPDASTVTVTVEPAGEGGSRVTLEHDGLSDVEAERHAQGWTHYLERLERVAATGDAGADEWAWAPETLTALVAAEAALAALQPVLRGVSDAARPRPTPCTDFTCDDLVGHLVGSLEQLGAMAGAPDGSEPVGDASAEERVSVAAGRAIDAWRAVDLDGSLPGPGGAGHAGRRPREHPAARAGPPRVGPRAGHRADPPALRGGRRPRPRPRRGGRPRRARPELRRRGHPGRRRILPGPARGLCRPRSPHRLTQDPSAAVAGTHPGSRRRGRHRWKGPRR